MVHFGDLSWTGKRIDHVTRNGGRAEKWGSVTRRTGSDGDQRLYDSTGFKMPWAGSE